MFGSKGGTYNPQMTDGHEPLHYAVNKSTSDLYGDFKSVESRTGATNRYPKSIVSFNVVNNNDRVHPTQKPVELFKYLIKMFSNEEEIVFDPFAGSLTTAVAAQSCQRRYICIEKEKEYTDTGLCRLQGVFDD